MLALYCMSMSLWLPVVVSIQRVPSHCITSWHKPRHMNDGRERDADANQNQIFFAFSVRPKVAHTFSKIKIYFARYSVGVGLSWYCQSCCCCNNQFGRTQMHTLSVRKMEGNWNIKIRKCSSVEWMFNSRNGNMCGGRYWVVLRCIFIIRNFIFMKCFWPTAAAFSSVSKSFSFPLRHTHDSN